MIFVHLDENVSPILGEIAKSLRIRQDVSFNSSQSLGERGMADVDWMTALSKRGRKKGALRIAFSSDSFSDIERAAAEQLQITLFYTPRMYWRTLRSVHQAAYFLRWLPALLDMAEASPAGTQFRLPNHFNPRSDLKPLKPVTDRRPIRPGRPKTPRRPKPLPLLD